MLFPFVSFLVVSHTPFLAGRTTEPTDRPITTPEIYSWTWRTNSTAREPPRTQRRVDGAFSKLPDLTHGSHGGCLPYAVIWSGPLPPALNFATFPLSHNFQKHSSTRIPIINPLRWYPIKINVPAIVIRLDRLATLYDLWMGCPYPLAHQPGSLVHSLIRPTLWTLLDHSPLKIRRIF